MSPPLTRTAAKAPTSQTVPLGESSTPHPDLLAAARVLHDRGWSEAAAECALDTFRAQGVVGLRRRVSRMSPAQDRKFREQFAREAKAHKKNRRGDLIRLRSAPHWPWRISTGASA